MNHSCGSAVLPSPNSCRLAKYMKGSGMINMHSTSEVHDRSFILKSDSANGAYSISSPFYNLCSVNKGVPGRAAHPERPHATRPPQTRGGDSAATRNLHTGWKSSKFLPCMTLPDEPCMKHSHSRSASCYKPSEDTGFGPKSARL